MPEFCGDHVSSSRRAGSSSRWLHRYLRWGRLESLRAWRKAACLVRRSFSDVEGVLTPLPEGYMLVPPVRVDELWPLLCPWILQAMSETAEYSDVEFIKHN